MPQPYLHRIPTLSEAELREYVQKPMDFRLEAVEAAIAELERRGLGVATEDLLRIRLDLGQRDTAQAEAHGRWVARHLGATVALRQARVRLITGGILVLGLSSAAAIYLGARAQGPNPLGYEPEDTKRYLRDLEMYGGKLNILATQAMRWWEGLWRGPQLGITLAWLTLLSAGLFWFLASRQVPEQDLGG
jgi:hypothetical protein